MVVRTAPEMETVLSALLLIILVTLTTAPITLFQEIQTVIDNNSSLATLPNKRMVKLKNSKAEVR